MDFDDDDIYEVLLVHLRLATWLGLENEQRILADGLIDGGFPKEVVDIWQRPLDGNLQQEVADTLKNLAEYRCLILTFPDIFAGGMIGRCCGTISDEAERIESASTSNILKLCSA